MKNTSRVFMTLLGGIFLFFALVSHVAAQAVTVTPAMASAQAGSSTWITVSSPFSGDANANSYTVYEYSTSSSGPWTQVCGNATPGESAWRHCAFSGLAPNTAYFVKVTFFDPDGVVGTNPQIIGPVQTAAAPSAAVTVGTASATVQDTYILVSVPISGDSNLNSLPSVEVATGSGGPWTQKCGPYASFSPKLCRIHGLTQGSDYWVRVTVSDPDGVNGSNPQVFGPIQYTGLTNMALGKAITADPGWGCCSNPAQLVDGRIQNVNWNYGFAWTGGTGCWAGGCPPGFKQATIDLGSPQTISRLDWWTHDPGSIPTTWKVLVSTDGVVFTEVFSTTAPACRTATLPLNVSWAFPSCGHLATFTPVTARYVRYTFDDRTLFDGIHGWAVEIEVFAQASANQPPVANAGADQTVECTSSTGTAVTLDGTGSSDPDGDALAYTWAGSFGAASGPTPTVSLPLGVHTITLTVDDGEGGTASDTVDVQAKDTTPPSIQAATASPSVLWPPNHKMVPVSVAASASDNCGSPTTEIFTAMSNEPDNGLGDGDTPSDIQITGPLSVLLRAERSGKGSGRVYTITVLSTDTSGNTSTKDVTVTVPRDQRK